MNTTAVRASLTILSLLALISCGAVATANPSRPGDPGYRMPSPFLNDVRLSGDGRRALHVTDRGVELWDIGIERCVRTVAGAENGWIAPDGERLVTVRAGAMHLETWGGELLASFPGSSFDCVLVGRSGLVHAGKGDTSGQSQLGIPLQIEVYVEARSLTGQLLWKHLRKEQPFRMWPSGVAARDERLVLIDDAGLSAWKASDGVRLWSHDIDRLNPPMCPWKQSGVAWADDHDRIRVMTDVGASEQTLSLPPSPGVWEIAASEDGRWVAVGAKRMVTVYDSANGRAIARTSSGPGAIAFAAADSLVVVDRAMKVQRLAIQRRKPYQAH